VGRLVDGHAEDDRAGNGQGDVQGGQDERARAEGGGVGVSVGGGSGGRGGGAQLGDARADPGAAAAAAGAGAAATPAAARRVPRAPWRAATRPATPVEAATRRRRRRQKVATVDRKRGGERVGRDGGEERRPVARVGRLDRREQPVGSIQSAAAPQRERSPISGSAATARSSTGWGAKVGAASASIRTIWSRSPGVGGAGAGMGPMVRGEGGGRGRAQQAEEKGQKSSLGASGGRREDARVVGRKSAWNEVPVGCENE